MNPSKTLHTIRVYSILGLIISVFSVIQQLRSPSETKSAILLGLSTPRLGLVAIPLFIGLFFIWLFIATLRGSSSDRLLQSIDFWLNHKMIPYITLYAALFISIFSVIFLYYTKIVVGWQYYYLLRHLVPFFGWLFFFSVLTLTAMIILKGYMKQADLWGMVLLLGLACLGLIIHFQIDNLDDPTDRDIYYVFVEGQRLKAGENPYQRVLSGDMRQNQKYATYLPVSYYLSWGSQLIGLRRFENWIDFWKFVFTLALILIAVLLFYIPYRQNMLILAVFSALFWLFNRWTLSVSAEVDFDFLPLLFLILSLMLFERHQTGSFLLLGLSLAIKHMALFVIPLYLIWTWQEANNYPTRKVAYATVTIATIPMIVSLPFMFWNLDGFIKSILFSATRLPVTNFGTPSIDAYFNLVDIPAKIPLLLLTILVYLIAWQRLIRPYTAVLLVMVTFINFFSILFRSYFIYMMPFIPLAVYELALEIKKRRVLN